MNVLKYNNKRDFLLHLISEFITLIFITDKNIKGTEGQQRHWAWLLTPTAKTFRIYDKSWPFKKWLYLCKMQHHAFWAHPGEA